MKKRLDQVLLEKALVDSIDKAGAYIMEGKVKVKGVVIYKPGHQVQPSDEISLTLPEISFVSRGGYKLHGTIKELGIHIQSKTAMDIGSSTGGFTDCLLQHGAEKVYAIDVGKGLIDYRLRQNKRVVIMEGINFRHFDTSALQSQIDIATVDVSFISLGLILPGVFPCLKHNGIVLALIKPQFELDKKDVWKGGIVKSPDKHEKAVSKVRDIAAGLGFEVLGVIPSVIKGTKGNQEFFIHLKKP